MKRYWEQLKPQERRWAVGIGVVVFLMLNYFFVWPHRNDWGRDGARMNSALKTNQIYRTEIGHKEEYTRKLREMQSDGSEVLPEDQAIDFIHFLSSREVAHRITSLNNGPLVTRTNDAFFVEQQMGISVMADETNLVNFLYSLSEGNSMMRVRAMSLHPDPSHEHLNASLTLVASYQKKGPARTGGASTRPASIASTAPVEPRPVRPAAPLANVPPPGSTPQRPAPFARPPGNFPNAPANGQAPSPFARNPAANATDPSERTNRIAGAFARPSATPKKMETTAQ